MKLFSVEEANALVPELRRQWQRVDAARAQMRRLAPEVKLASENTGGGGTAYGVLYANALDVFMTSVQGLLELGIEIKDFDRGLCDFPHLRDGRVVYLCWQKGEDRIEWWHDTDAGFAGRQPL
ncbi:MAG: DUF2203 domain-containing protein [Acidobacteria bacterium]|nr:DUF2203 domain-containing protein [Acidobacteriota bacterium]